MSGHLHQRVRHVVWDWNGTLLDDVDHCIAIMNGMLRDARLPELDVHRYRSVFDFPVRTYYERLGFDLGGDNWEILAKRFIESYDRGVLECELREGADAALRRLSDRGVGSSVLSAARRHSIVEVLDHHGLLARFGDIVGLDDHYAHGKEELGVRWLEVSGVDPETTVYVGDTCHDHEVAEAMGIRCVLVANGHHPRERLEACGCPVVDSLDEL